MITRGQCFCRMVPSGDRRSSRLELGTLRARLFLQVFQRLVVFRIHVRIERAQGQPPISEKEWLAVVADDLELSLADGASFWYSAGRIRMTSSERPQLLKAEQLAQRLGAHVIGEEGESYMDGAPIALPKSSLWSAPIEAPSAATTRLAQDLLGMYPHKQARALAQIADIPERQVAPFLEYVFTAVARNDPYMFVEDMPELKEAIIRLPEPATALLEQVTRLDAKRDHERLLATHALEWRAGRR